MGAAQVGANLLALPRTLAVPQQEAALTQQVLTQLGMTPQEAQTYSPAPQQGPITGLLAATPDRGTAGKVLAGIGDVGVILSAALGGHVPAPRPNLGAAAGLAQLNLGRQKRERAAAVGQAISEGKPRQEVASLLAEDSPATAANLAYREESRNPTEWSLLLEHAKNAGLSGADATTYALRAMQERRLERSVAAGQAQGQIQVHTQTAKDVAKSQLNAQRVGNLIGGLEGAVNRQITADSVISRLMQAGQLAAFEQSPGVVGRMMGLNPQQITQLSDDVALLKSPEAFAGQILKGLGEDAGRLSDFDIARVTRRMPRIGDARSTAQAKLKVFKDLVQNMMQLAPGADASDLAVDAMGRFDAAETTPEAGAPGTMPAHGKVKILGAEVVE